MKVSLLYYGSTLLANFTQFYADIASKQCQVYSYSETTAKTNGYQLILKLLMSAISLFLKENYFKRTDRLSPLKLYILVKYVAFEKRQTLQYYGGNLEKMIQEFVVV